MRRWWTVILLMAVIFATSSTVVHSRALIRSVASNSPLPVSESGFRQFWESWWWLFVKGYHVVEFAILTWLLLRATSGRVLTACAIAVAFAASDEFHQTFVADRGGMATDVAIDAIGVALAAAIWIAWARASTAGKSPQGRL